MKLSVRNSGYFTIPLILQLCSAIQTQAMAKAFQGQGGVMIRALLAEAQFGEGLASALRERWTLPRRKMALGVFQEAIRRGEIR